jgi:hypothetical protein
VEIKTRMASIPECMPAHDALQVLTYLEMTRAPRAMYVQRRAHTAELRVQHINRDPALWEAAMAPRVRAFVCDVRRLLRGAPQDEGLRHRALAAVEALPPPRALLAEPPPAALDLGGGSVSASAADVLAPDARPLEDLTPMPAPPPGAVAEAVAAASAAAAVVAATKKRAAAAANLPPRLGPPPPMPSFLAQ